MRSIDYKKIIKSRELRSKILRLLSFVPDKTMLKAQYFVKTGRKLNINSPERYTEKIQYYKMNYRTQLMVDCVDKYKVRNYVKTVGLSSILIECYGVYNNFEEIDFYNLPNSFVIKDTLGGGGTSLLFVQDKSNIEYAVIKKTIDKWISKKNVRMGGREWPYYAGEKHRIIIEKYIESDKEKGGLIDYKFLCFNGKTEIIMVLADRIMGQDAGCGFFDSDFNRLPVSESDERKLKRKIEKPGSFLQMKKYAEILAKPFPCARIDLYYQNDEILFGEITFYDSSGYMTFDPDSFDYELGKKFNVFSNKGEQNNDMLFKV